MTHEEELRIVLQHLTALSEQALAHAAVYFNDFDRLGFYPPAQKQAQQEHNILVDAAQIIERVLRDGYLYDPKIASDEYRNPTPVLEPEDAD